MAALREILIAFGMTLDASPIDKAEKKVEGFLGKLKSFGEALAGAFAIKQVVAFERAQISLGDELGDQAALLDLSTQALEEWKFAAQFAEISGEELVGMFTKISRAANSAEDASSEQGKALQKLGINVKDYKTSAEVFQAIGTRLAELEPGYKRTALAAQFFGRTAGTKVLQLFKDGDAGIEKYLESFEELGGGMRDFAQAAGEVDDEQKKLNFAFGNLKIRIAGVLLPAFRFAIETATKWSAELVKLVEKTKLIQTALVVLGALSAGKAALIIARWLPVIAPFLAWAAAIGLVILVAEDLFGFFEGRRSLIGRAIDKAFGEGTQEKVRAWFKSVKEIFTQAVAKWREIFETSTASFQGNLQALIAFIEGSFSEQLRAIFGDVVGDVIGQFLSASVEVIAIFQGMAATIRDIFVGITEFIGKTVFAATDGAANEQAKAQAAARSGKPVADAAGIQAHLAQAPLLVRAFAAVTGFRPEQAVPVRVPGATNNTTTNGAPEVNIAITVPAGTPAAQARAVGEAAKRGTTAALTAPNRAAARGLARTGAKT